MAGNLSNKRTSQESISSRTQIIVFGLVIAIIGSVIAASYQKATLTNYAGFGMLLGGVAIFVFGLCATTCATVNSRCPEVPARTRTKVSLVTLGVWTAGAGAVLSIFGSTLSAGYAKSSELNLVGFGMLLSGICCIVLGIFGALLGYMQLNQHRRGRQTGLRIDRPRFLNYSVLSIGVGLVLIIVGTIVAGAYAKETTLNYSGFGMLLAGVAVLTIGMSGTAVTIVKSTWDFGETDDVQPGVILGSIWAIGIGAMLLIIGSLVASSYAKDSLMNYTGFGMILSGTAVFVYGLFETARFSALGYLSGRFTNPLERRTSFWSRTVKSRVLLNLTGVMVAMGLLFFSLWQLDLIVSGPVWWQSSANGAGWSWPGPGAYSKDYFQCFLWKTTVGQAYDTLFTLIFVSFIILFASAFFWPRSSGLTHGSNQTSRYNGQKRSRVKRTRNNGQPQPVDIPPARNESAEATKQTNVES